MIRFLLPFTLLFALSGCLVGPDFTRVRGPAGDGYYYLSREGNRIFKIRPPIGEWWTSYPALPGSRVIKDEPIVFTENSRKDGRHAKATLIADFSPTRERGEFTRWSNYLAQWQLGASAPGSKGTPGESTNLRALLPLDLDGMHCPRSERVLEKYGVYTITITCPGFSRNTFGVASIQVSVSLEGGEAAAREIMSVIEKDIQRSLSSMQFIEPFSQIAPKGFSIDGQLIK